MVDRSVSEPDGFSVVAAALGPSEFVEPGFGGIPGGILQFDDPAVAVRGVTEPAAVRVGKRRRASVPMVAVADRPPAFIDGSHPAFRGVGIPALLFAARDPEQAAVFVVFVPVLGTVQPLVGRQQAVPVVGEALFAPGPVDQADQLSGLVVLQGFPFASGVFPLSGQEAGDVAQQVV